MKEFVEAILKFRQKYQWKKTNLLSLQLGDICSISLYSSAKKSNTEVVSPVLDIVVDRDKEVNQIGYVRLGKDMDVTTIKKYYGISHVNVGFNPKYVASILFVCSNHFSRLSLDVLKGYPIVYASISCQKVFAKVFDYIQACKDGMDSERQFFLRLLEIMARQLDAEANQTVPMQIDMVRQVELLPELDDEKNNITSIYQKCSNVDSPIMLLLLKSLDI